MYKSAKVGIILAAFLAIVLSTGCISRATSHRSDTDTSTEPTQTLRADTNEGATSDQGQSTPEASTNGTESSQQTMQAEPMPETSNEQALPYLITIDGAQVVQDYDGDRALLVNFTFTNNSSEATSFSSGVYVKAFQNGVQLDDSYVASMEMSSYNEVKPGATTTAQEAFKLRDNSDVTVECEEFLSWDDTILAEATFSVA